jgi:tetratricopeptide (TPR) repeat protein
MRRLFIRFLSALAIALAFIPQGFAQDQQRLTAADVAGLKAKAEAGDPAAMRALGDAYRDGDDLDAAIGWYERAGEAGNSTALFNLGQVLTQRGREGDGPRAIDVLGKALAAYEKSLGPDNPRTGAVHMVLASAYDGVGRFTEALDSNKKAYAIFAKAFGEESPDAAKVLGNMGINYEGLARYDEAIDVLTRALAIFAKVHDAEHPEIANLHINLAIAYEEVGRLDEALAAEKKAAAIQARVYGADHPETALVIANMGSTLNRMGRRDDAIKAYEKALPILSKAYGEDHPLTARNLADLATVYADAGRYDEALAALKTALPVLTRSLGPEYPSVVFANYNLGLVYDSLSEFDQALAAFRKALPLFEKIYGADSAETAQVRAAMGNVYSELNRNDEAVAEIGKALPVIEKAYGDHGRVAMLYNNLGAALDGLGRYQEALAAYDKAIAIETKRAGPGVSEIAEGLVNKANAYQSLGRNDEAMREILRALVLYGVGQARLDPVRKAYWALARTLDKEGNRRAAIIFAKEAVNAHQELRLRNERLPADLRSSLARGLRWVYDLLAKQEIADGAFAEAQYAASLIKEEELFDFTTRGSSGGPAPKGEVRLTRPETRVLNRFAVLLKKPTKIIGEVQRLAEKQRKGALSLAEEARFAALTKDLDEAYDDLARDAVRDGRAGPQGDPG